MSDNDLIRRGDALALLEAIAGGEEYLADRERLVATLPATLPAAVPDVAGLVRAACNLRAFVDLFAGGDEGMRLAVREFDAALAAMEEARNGQS